MANIFLSHSGQDEQIAERLRNQLEQMGSKVYMFEHDQQPGRDITDKLTKAIDSCEVLFALFTTQGGHSNYVQQEIGYAKKARKPVVPFVESGTDHSALGMLVGTEYIKFDPDNPDKSISDAQTYVHSHDMKKLAIGAGASLIVIFVVVALLYYTYSD